MITIRRILLQKWKNYILYQPTCNDILFIIFTISVAYPSSEVTYRWHNPTMAVGYEGELQMSQFDIIDNKYRQVNFSRDATGNGDLITM